MTTPLTPGARGECVPSAENVFRLLKLSKDGRASELEFTLSEADKASNLKSLSVWVESLTSPQQALVFMGEEKREGYQCYAVINVAAIRELRPEPDSPDIQPYLDVVWDPLTDETTGTPDSRPGAQGHSGITGLKRESIPNSSKMYKSLRYKLADLANENLRSSF